MRRHGLTNRILMGVILLLAVYLRIYQLDTIPNGLLNDEAMRGYDAYAILKTGADSFGNFPLFLRSFDDYTPALYSFMCIPFIYAFGLSVFSTRLAAALSGVIVVALTYPTARRSFGQNAALVAAFLVAISPWHILPSRTGAEWILLSLGPLLTINLAYRGLKKPYALVGAGIVAGISLYGYAPTKMFLPILITGFVIFYWRELYHQKKAFIIAFVAFVIIAVPIYIFSFTPHGMNRFNQIYEGSNLSLTETAFQFIRNYFSYFSPTFYGLNEYMPGTHPPAFASLESVGLLSWSEVILVLLGIIYVFQIHQKNSWFILIWLIIAPIGINLHMHSPWPTLWLAAIPIPQVLAGAGFAWMFSILGFKSGGGDLIS